MSGVLKEMTQLMQRIPELVDRDDFYHTYRPVLDGFFPSGIILRLDTRNRPNVNDIRVSPKGPSAGQSTIFLLFDLILGIKHVNDWATSFHKNNSDTPPWLKQEMDNDKENNEERKKKTIEKKETKKEEDKEEEDKNEIDSQVIGKFQLEMLSWYTPKPHQLFVHDYVNAMKMSGYSSIKDYIRSNNAKKDEQVQGDHHKNSYSSFFYHRRLKKESISLQSAYDDVLSDLVALRKEHMKVAVLFLSRGGSNNHSSSTSSSTSSSPSTMGDKDETEVGTGATSFKILLSEALSNTRKAKFPKQSRTQKSKCE